MRGCLIPSPGGTSIIHNEANNASLICHPDKDCARFARSVRKTQYYTDAAVAPKNLTRSEREGEPDL